MSLEKKVFSNLKSLKKRPNSTYLNTNDKSAKLLLRNCHGFQIKNASCAIDSLLVALYAHSFSPFVRCFTFTVNQKYSKEAFNLRKCLVQLIQTYYMPLFFVQDSSSLSLVQSLSKIIPSKYLNDIVGSNNDISTASDDFSESVVSKFFENMQYTDLNNLLEKIIPIFYKRPYIVNNNKNEYYYSRKLILYKDNPKMNYEGLDIFNIIEESEFYSMIKKIIPIYNCFIVSVQSRRLTQKSKNYCDLPNKVKVNNSLYYLCSVVSYKALPPEDLTAKSDHFITFLRDERMEKDIWYYYDDFQANTRKITDQYLNFSQVRDVITKNGLIYIYYNPELPNFYKDIEEWLC